MESRATFRFNAVLEKVLEKVPESFGAKPGQVQRGFKVVGGAIPGVKFQQILDDKICDNNATEA